MADETEEKQKQFIAKVFGAEAVPIKYVDWFLAVSSTDAMVAIDLGSMDPTAKAAGVDADVAVQVAVKLRMNRDFAKNLSELLTQILAEDGSDEEDLL